MTRLLRAGLVTGLALTLVSAESSDVRMTDAAASEGVGELAGSAPRSGAPAANAPPARQEADFERPGRHAFYWTRGAYSGGGGGWGWGRRNAWATDYPKSDIQFVTVLQRLVRLDVFQEENAVRLDDPILRHFPVLYMVEVGYMDLGDSEVEGLRGFLDSGGFLIVDDFWGARQWAVFQENIERVLPDKAIVDLPLEHPVFSIFYDIDEVKQVPAYRRDARYGITTECRGCEATVRGIFDDDGRLMVIINWNTDLGDAWEWAEQPSYPLEYSTYAYQMGANMIVYAMSH
jgi:hypothetical protein